MSGSLAHATSTLHSGLYRLAVTGTGLDAGAASDIAAKAQQSAELADAIVAAIARARASGLQSFEPSDAALVPPADMTAARLRELFRDVVGMPYEGTVGLTPDYRALSLSEWSDAAMALRRASAALISRLAPGEGGGLHHAGGTWYVNGQAYTLAESFLALRFSTYSTLDVYLSDQLNKANNNTLAARKLVGLVRDLNTSFAAGGGSAGSYPAAGVMDLLDARGLTLAELATWGRAVADGGNFATLLADYAANPSLLLTGTTYAALIAEGKAVFDAFNADNQVSQLRLDSVVNQRQNVVNGMSSFLQGYQNQQATLGRMLAGG